MKNQKVPMLHRTSFITQTTDFCEIHFSTFSRMFCCQRLSVWGGGGEGDGLLFKSAMFYIALVQMRPISHGSCGRQIGKMI